MLHALISPKEIWTDENGVQGARIAQVESNTFEVAKPLFWVDCNDDCNTYGWFYVGDQIVPYVPAPIPE